MKNYYKMSTLFIVFFVIVIFIGYGIVNNNSVFTDNKNIYPVIVIDAGHGGFDGGTQSADGTLEKDINLRISTMLNEILKLKGFDTVMTRTTDSDTADNDKNTIKQKKISDIHNRLNLVNSYENSVLVSIHQNYFESSIYSGTQVFYSANNIQSQSLADCIQKSVVENIQIDNNRVIKPSGKSIYILYNAVKPSVMVECGFLSNEAETVKLKSDDYCRKLAYSIALGVEKYLKNNNSDV